MLAQLALLLDWLFRILVNAARVHGKVIAAYGRIIISQPVLPVALLALAYLLLVLVAVGRRKLLGAMDSRAEMGRCLWHGWLVLLGLQVLMGLWPEHALAISLPVVAVALLLWCIHRVRVRRRVALARAGRVSVQYTGAPLGRRGLERARAVLVSFVRRNGVGCLLFMVYVLMVLHNINIAQHRLVMHEVDAVPVMMRGPACAAQSPAHAVQWPWFRCAVPGSLRTPPTCTSKDELRLVPVCADKGMSLAVRAWQAVLHLQAGSELPMLNIPPVRRALHATGELVKLSATAVRTCWSKVAVATSASSTPSLPAGRSLPYALLAVLQPVSPWMLGGLLGVAATALAAVAWFVLLAVTVALSMVVALFASKVGCGLVFLVVLWVALELLCWRARVEEWLEDHAKAAAELKQLYDAYHRHVERLQRQAAAHREAKQQYIQAQRQAAAARGGVPTRRGGVDRQSHHASFGHMNPHPGWNPVAFAPAAEIMNFVTAYNPNNCRRVFAPRWSGCPRLCWRDSVLRHLLKVALRGWAVAPAMVTMRALQVVLLLLVGLLLWAYGVALAWNFVSLLQQPPVPLSGAVAREFWREQGRRSSPSPSHGAGHAHADASSSQGPFLRNLVQWYEHAAGVACHGVETATRRAVPNSSSDTWQVLHHAAIPNSTAWKLDDTGLCVVSGGRPVFVPPIWPGLRVLAGTLSNVVGSVAGQVLASVNSAVTSLGSGSGPLLPYAQYNTALKLCMVPLAAVWRCVLLPSVEQLGAGLIHLCTAYCPVEGTQAAWPTGNIRHALLNIWIRPACFIPLLQWSLVVLLPLVVLCVPARKRRVVSAMPAEQAPLPCSPHGRRTQRLARRSPSRATPRADVRLHQPAMPVPVCLRQHSRMGAMPAGQAPLHHSPRGRRVPEPAQAATVDLSEPFAPVPCCMMKPVGLNEAPRIPALQGMALKEALDVFIEWCLRQDLAHSQDEEFHISQLLVAVGKTSALALCMRDKTHELGWQSPLEYARAIAREAHENFLRARDAAPLHLTSGRRTQFNDRVAALYRRAGFRPDAALADQLIYWEQQAADHSASYARVLAAQQAAGNIRAALDVAQQRHDSRSPAEQLSWLQQHPSADIRNAARDIKTWVDTEVQLDRPGHSEKHKRYADRQFTEPDSFTALLWLRDYLVQHVGAITDAHVEMWHTRRMSAHQTPLDAFAMLKEEAGVLAKCRCVHFDVGRELLQMVSSARLKGPDPTPFFGPTLHELISNQVRTITIQNKDLLTQDRRDDLIDTYVQTAMVIYNDLIVTDPTRWAKVCTEQDARGVWKSWAQLTADSVKRVARGASVPAPGNSGGRPWCRYCRKPGHDTDSCERARAGAVAQADAAATRVADSKHMLTTTPAPGANLLDKGMNPRAKYNSSGSGAAPATRPLAASGQGREWRPAAGKVYCARCSEVAGKEVKHAKGCFLDGHTAIPTWYNPTNKPLRDAANKLRAARGEPIPAPPSQATTVGMMLPQHADALVEVYPVSGEEDLRWDGGVPVAVSHSASHDAHCMMMQPRVVAFGSVSSLAGATAPAPGAVGQQPDMTVPAGDEALRAYLAPWQHDVPCLGGVVSALLGFCDQHGFTTQRVAMLERFFACMTDDESAGHRALYALLRDGAAVRAAMRSVPPSPVWDALAPAPPAASAAVDLLAPVHTQLAQLQPQISHAVQTAVDTQQRVESAHAAIATLAAQSADVQRSAVGVSQLHAQVQTACQEVQQHVAELRHALGQLSAMREQVGEAHTSAQQQRQLALNTWAEVQAQLVDLPAQLAHAITTHIATHPNQLQDAVQQVMGCSAADVCQWGARTVSHGAALAALQQGMAQVQADYAALSACVPVAPLGGVADVDVQRLQAQVDVQRGALEALQQQFAVMVVDGARTARTTAGNAQLLARVAHASLPHTPAGTPPAVSVPPSPAPSWGAGDGHVALAHPAPELDGVELVWPPQESEEGEDVHMASPRVLVLPPPEAAAPALPVLPGSPSLDAADVVVAHVPADRERSPRRSPRLQASPRGSYNETALADAAVGRSPLRRSGTGGASAGGSRAAVLMACSSVAASDDTLVQALQDFDGTYAELEACCAGVAAASPLLPVECVPAAAALCQPAAAAPVAVAAYPHRVPDGLSPRITEASLRQFDAHGKFCASATQLRLRDQFVERDATCVTLTQQEHATSLFLHDVQTRHSFKPARVMVDSGAALDVCVSGDLARRMGVTWEEGSGSLVGVGGTGGCLGRANELVLLTLGGSDVPGDVRVSAFAGRFAVRVRPYILSPQAVTDLQYDVVVGVDVLRPALATFDWVGETMDISPAFLSDACADFRVSIPCRMSKPTAKAVACLRALPHLPVQPLLVRNVAAASPAVTPQPSGWDACVRMAEQAAAAAVAGVRSALVGRRRTYLAAAMHPGFPQSSQPPTHQQWRQRNMVRAARAQPSLQEAQALVSAAVHARGLAGAPPPRPGVIMPVAVCYALDQLQASGKLREGCVLDLGEPAASGVSAQQYAELRAELQALWDTVRSVVPAVPGRSAPLSTLTEPVHDVAVRAVPAPTAEAPGRTPTPPAPAAAAPAPPLGTLVGAAEDPASPRGRRRRSRRSSPGAVRRMPTRGAPLVPAPVSPHPEMPVVPADAPAAPADAVAPAVVAPVVATRLPWHVPDSWAAVKGGLPLARAVQRLQARALGTALPSEPSSFVCLGRLPADTC